ncbi:hypothetical protein H7I53_15150 [Mycolicibacterium pulveris]|uniref:Ig-like domain-containing protein n=1 Tax=Mycolicibacterium pulveris TaxID=36813 RepID=UPI0013D24B8F|nr:Ig-like domain-containing protein [Mycolicibacterium pulveris]MCV6981552.1 hypothetical protein [Mycolicibacterium pulveris]
MAQGSHTKNRSTSTKRARRRHRTALRKTEPYRWLGAGVVALGLGATIASGSGVAHADGGTGGTTSSTGSADSNATDGQSTGAQSGSTAETPGDLGTPTGDDAPTQSDAAVTGPGAATPPTSTVSSSGGNLSAISGSPDEPTTDTADSELTEDAIAEIEDGSPDPSPAEAIDTNDTTVVETDEDSNSRRDNDSPASLSVAEESTDDPGLGIVDREITASTFAPSTVTTVSVQQELSAGGSPVSAAEKSVAPTATSRVSIAPAADAPPAAPQSVVAQLLSFVGLAPLISDSPAAPFPLNLFEALFVEVRRLFFNQTPTMSVGTTTTLPTGQVTGTVTGSDPDGDAISFGASAPAHGSVTIDPTTETWTYTPDPGFVGTDSFALTVSDAAFHLHGPFGLFTPGQGHTASVPVTVTAGSVTSVAVGDGPWDIATSADGTRTYVTNSGSTTVSYIDTSSGSPEPKTITLSGTPAGISTNADGTLAFAALPDEGLVAVIDTSGETPAVHTVAVGGELPQYTAASADGSRVYTTSWDPGTQTSLLSVIDTSDPSQPVVIETVPLDGYYVERVVTGADGTRVYGTGYKEPVNEDEVLVMVDVTDVQDIQVTSIQFSEGRTLGLGEAVSADGTRVYVTYQNYDGDDSVVVVDATDFDDPKVIRIDAGFSPEAIAVSADGTRAYAPGSPSDGNGHAVYLIDTTDFANPVVIEIALPVAASNGVQDVATTADGTRAYVTNFIDGSLSIVDTSGTSPVAYRVAVGELPAAPVSSADGRYVYVTNFSSNTVTVVEVPTPTTVDAATSVAPFAAAAAVDPYIQQFLDADPTGRFFTPASTDFSHWISMVGPVFDPVTFEEGVALYGTTGFSRNAQGTLHYTNNWDFDVAVLHASGGNTPISGIVVVQPGQTAVIPNTYALAQAPRSYAMVGRPIAIVAVAGPGHPAAAPADLPSFLQSVLWDAGQKIVDSVVRNTQAAIANLLSLNPLASVMNGFQILFDVTSATVDVVARGVQGMFARLFGG